MLTARNMCAYGSDWETNSGRRGILSNVIATGDINWKCLGRQCFLGIKNVIYIKSTEFWHFLWFQIATCPRWTRSQSRQRLADRSTSQGSAWSGSRSARAYGACTRSIGTGYGTRSSNSPLTSPTPCPEMTTSKRRHIRCPTLRPVGEIVTTNSLLQRLHCLVWITEIPNQVVNKSAC